EIVTDPPGEIAAVASGSLADANGLGARRRSASGQHAGDVLLERRANGREQCPLRASGGAESVDHREEHALVGRSEKEVGMKADVQVLVEAKKRRLAKRPKREAGVDGLREQARKLLPELVARPAQFLGLSPRALGRRTRVGLPKIDPRAERAAGLHVLECHCGKRNGPTNPFGDGHAALARKE